MAIFRITNRTFQNEEHAALFLAITEQAITTLREKGIKAKAKIEVTQNKLHEVISFWEYNGEAHMKTVRSTLAKFSALLSSLFPKEINFRADVVKGMFVFLGNNLVTVLISHAGSLAHVLKSQSFIWRTLNET